jgi:hypothetical protein
MRFISFDFCLDVTEIFHEELFNCLYTIYLGEFNAALPTVKCQNCGMTQKTGPIKPKYKCECVASYENNTRRLILLDGPLRTHEQNCIQIQIR